MKKYIYIMIILGFILSCNNTNYFYPDGDVIITDYAVYTDSSSGSRVCNISYSISNLGTREINKTIFSYKVNSDKESYTSTESVEISIPPNKCIYMSFNVVLFDETEIVSTLDDITIESNFYY